MHEQKQCLAEAFLRMTLNCLFIPRYEDNSGYQRILYENILTNKILPITIFQQQLFVTGRISSMQLNMTKGKPLPVILMFTVPLIIGNVFQQLYNLSLIHILAVCVACNSVSTPAENSSAR